MVRLEDNIEKTTKSKTKEEVASTLTGFIAIEKTIEMAMQAASINAASVVGYIDTQTGLLEFAALEAQLNAHAKKLAVLFLSWAEIT